MSDSAGAEVHRLDDLCTSRTRFELWTNYVRTRGVRTVAEIGVYEGEFAAYVLNACSDIDRYVMVDPWRHLDDWNKPANASDADFDAMLAVALSRTASWAEKRTVLRGRTVEVVDSIPDASLDFIYVDGDHTLRGITVDLNQLWSKVRPGGLIGGDDFTASAWQHPEIFEPSAVFPYAVYFAESMGAPIEALPHNQFAIHRANVGFSFTDHVGSYPDCTLRFALRRPPGRLGRLRRNSR